MSPTTLDRTPAIVLHLGPLLERMSDDDFFQLCRLNPEWRIERTAEGDLIVMPPTGGETGARNFALTGELHRWVKSHGGVGFDSSTGFTLPNGARRSPDLAWVSRERWDALRAGEREQFPPLCPDFVVELRSRSDDLATLHDKMREYIANGARLGWLIDPPARTIHVYRPGSPVVRLVDPPTITGDPELPGLSIALSEIW